MLTFDRGNAGEPIAVDLQSLDVCELERPDLDRPWEVRRGRVGSRYWVRPDQPVRRRADRPRSRAIGDVALYR